MAVVRRRMPRPCKTKDEGAGGHTLRLHEQLFMKKGRRSCLSPEKIHRLGEYVHFGRNIPYQVLTRYPFA